MRRGDDDGGGHLLAGLERHARHAPVAHEDAGDRRVEPDLGAEPQCRLAERLGHRAHAALGEAPGTEPTAVTDVADLVVDHHVRRAR